MAHVPATLDAALASALVRDGARPLVTFYDDATGERAELSVASLVNAVAKTANLLVADLDVQPGDRVHVALPLHWQLAVWLGACWACGAVAALGDPPGDAAAEPVVTVVGPRGWDRATGARDVVAVSLEPFGMPFRDRLPAGVLDHAVEARAQGDVFTAMAPRRADDPALVLDGGPFISHAEVLAAAADLAARVGLGQGGRLLTTRAPADLDGALAVLALPLAVSGSTVLVRHADDPGRHVGAERADAVLS